MSELSALSELAALAGRPSGPAPGRRRPLSAAAALPARTGQKRGITELMGLVLTISARARRATLPNVIIDLDVFTPEGRRAVRIAQNTGA